MAQRDIECTLEHTREPSKASRRHQFTVCVPRRPVGCRKRLLGYPRMHWRALRPLECSGRPCRVHWEAPRSPKFSGKHWEVSRLHFEAPSVPESALGSSGQPLESPGRLLGDAGAYYVVPSEGMAGPCRLLGQAKAHWRALQGLRRALESTRKPWEPSGRC